MEWRPPLRSRFNCARFVRISLARWRASMRWTSDLSGAAACLVGEFVGAGGMVGECTDAEGAINVWSANLPPPRPHLERSSGSLTLLAAFPGDFAVLRARARPSTLLQGRERTRFPPPR